MTPIFVVGQGLIGAGVVARLRRDGHPVIAVARNPVADGLALDLSRAEDRAALAEAVREHAAACVVLVHGPSDVTWCAENPEAAIAVHEGVAAELADAGCPVVLVSTDNVFNGRRALNRTTDPVEPANGYGRAKLAAEQRLLGRPGHVVLRVSLVYGWSPRTQWRNYAEVCLAAAAAGAPIEAPDDQWFTPVHTDDVARVVAAVAAAPEKAPPLAHIAGPRHLSRVEFARTAYAVAGARPDLVHEVPRAATRWASRPQNSSLEPSDFSGVPGLADYRPRTPEEGLTHMRDGRRSTRSRECVLFGIDAGGSRTRVVVRDADGERTVTLGSVNPAAVGADLAAENLHDTLCFVRDAAGGRDVRGWLASATVGPETSAEQIRSIASAAEGVGLRGTVTISNDTIPLLVASPLRGAGSVVVVGTGTGFLAGDGAGRVTRSGGYEYLASDEASAFDLGLLALRAAGRAIDGRDRPTRLVQALEERLGADLPTAARRLAALPHPKHAVAALAPVVCETWLEGDPVATGIVTEAVDRIASFTARLRRRTPCPPGSGTVITGGIPAGCAPFADALRAALRETCGDHPVEVRPDATAAALELAERVPAPVEGDVHWTVPLEGGAS